MFIRGFIICGFCLSLLTCSATADITMDFEDLTVGTEYDVGDTFTSAGINVEVHGDPSTNTMTLVGTSGGYVGTGNVIESYADRWLEFLLPQTFTAASFQYGCGGGINQIRVNGDPSPLVESFSSLDGLTLGGVSISAVGIDTGTVMLSGDISTLDIAGQEMILDNVIFVPEPATMGLLAIGGLALLRRRQSRG